jgi:hypothetical protein
MLKCQVKGGRGWLAVHQTVVVARPPARAAVQGSRIMGHGLSEGAASAGDDAALPHGRLSTMR